MPPSDHPDARIDGVLHFEEERPVAALLGRPAGSRRPEAALARLTRSSTSKRASEHQRRAFALSDFATGLAAIEIGGIRVRLRQGCGGCSSSWPAVGLTCTCRSCWRRGTPPREWIGIILCSLVAPYGFVLGRPLSHVTNAFKIIGREFDENAKS